MFLAIGGCHNDYIVVVGFFPPSNLFILKIEPHYLALGGLEVMVP